ncbi:lipoyl domain-containing protein [Arthrobacter sp. 35W]|uniref:lipoyl domain-containing protein n=1 Tax=Arthrobacter sp. 35W TaxID=1132441 RepID=UPI00041214C6|nr:lipoyl domain-containing protein [Arthrobacter sp. 35W]
MDITMPKWGMTMQEGVLLQWLVAVGDHVTEGQAVATVETEKVDAEIEAPASGLVAELLVDAGESVDVGTAIARLS